MGDVGRFIVGAAMVVGGIITVNPGLIIAGASTIGAVLLSPGDVGDRQKGFQGEVVGTESPLVVIYGRAQVGVNIYETRVDTSSPDNRYLSRGGAICLGSQATQAAKGIEGVEVVRINNRDAILPVSGDTIDFSTTMTTDGVQSPWDETVVPPISSPEPVLEYSLFSGLRDQSVPNDLNTRYSSLWDSDHRGRGVAHILIGARFDREVYTTGIPRLQMIVRGQHVFDPRDNLWKYSENPWLCALDYLLSRGYGKGVYRGLNEPLYWALHNLSAATGSTTLFDDKPLSEIGLSVGQDVSCAVELRSDSGVDQIRHRLVWKDSGLVTIRTDQSTITTSSSFDRVELEGITIPANAEYLTWEVVNLDGADTWAFQRAELLKRSTMLPFLDRVDLQSFIDEANYADESVSVNVDGTPTNKTRFTIGGFLSTADDVDRNLQLITAAARGNVIFEGGRFRATSRKGTATPSGYKLTPDKLVGEWRVRRMGVEDAPNTIQVTYTDQDREFQAHDVVWPEEDDFALLDADKGFEADVEMGIPFVPDETTAKQIGMVTLREMRQDVTIEATVTHEAMQLQVHDLIEVTLPTEGWTDKQFWVVALQMRPDYTVDLVLREFDSSAYDLSDQTAEASVPGTELPDPFSINPVSGLTLTSDASTAVDTQDGFRVPGILVQWTEPSDAFVDRYIIRYKKNADSEFIRWPDSDRGDTQTSIYPVTEGELYDVEVVAENTMGIRSTVASAQVTPASLPSEPISGGLLGRNLDFEAGDVGWGKSAEAAITEDVTNALRGSWVASISDTAGTGDEITNDQTFSVAPGERILAEAWIKSTAGADGNCAVRIEWQDESGTALSESVGNNVAGGTTSYTRSKLVTTAPSGAVQARVEAQSTSQTAGTFYIDDVVVGRLLSDEDMSPSTIALTINADASGSSNPGEFALSAVENGNADYTRDGRILWDGSEIAVPRDAGDGFTSLTGGAADGQKGFILFDTAKPGTPRFTVNGTARHVVFAYKKSDGNWYYDQNTGETTFTPQSSDVALGWLEKGTGDNLARGGLFGAPVDLELAAFPTADPTADNSQDLDWLVGAGSVGFGSPVGMIIDGDAEQLLFGDATSPSSGTGIFLGLSGGNYQFRAGNPGGDQILWDGATLTVVGDITATTISADSGDIGGWDITASAIQSPSASVAIDSANEQIRFSTSGPLTGAGIFMGLSGGGWDFRAGDPAGDYIHWDGSAGVLTLVGEIIDTANFVDGSVTSAKIGNYEIIPDNMSPESLGQHGVWMNVFERSPASLWVEVNAGSAAALSVVDGVGQAGGKALEAAGHSWMAYPENIPYDPSKLYRIRCRVRRTATADAATQRFYCGVEGVAADGTTLINTSGADSHSSQHYLAASGVDGSAWTLNEWQEFTGWFKGTGTGPHTSQASPDSPAVLETGVRYFRPLFIMNYQNGPSGNVMQLDYIVVDVFDEDGLVRSYLGLNVDGVVAADKVVASSIDVASLSAVSAAMGTLTSGEISVGSMTLSADNETLTFGAATAPLSGVGIFAGLSGGVYEFRAGDPSGQYIHWDGSALTITGSITIQAGSTGVANLGDAGALAQENSADWSTQVAGTGKPDDNADVTSSSRQNLSWLLTAGLISAGNLDIDADNEQIRLGSASAPLTGTGIFLGLSGGVYEFRAGDPAGEYIHWDGSSLTVGGTVTAESFTGSNPVFTGTVTVEAGSGGDSLIELIAFSGGRGAIYLRDETNTRSASWYVGGTSVDIQATNGHDLQLFAAGGDMLLQPDGDLNLEPSSDAGEIFITTVGSLGARIVLSTGDGDIDLDPGSSYVHFMNATDGTIRASTGRYLPVRTTDGVRYLRLYS